MTKLWVSASVDSLKWTCPWFLCSVPSLFCIHQQDIDVYLPLHVLFISDWFVCIFISLPAVSLHVSSSPPLPPHSVALPHPGFLHSMRLKASNLCLPLPPLLRLNTLCSPSRPAPRWMTERWRRSWKSASGCRWKCRGYEKKINRSGWVCFCSQQCGFCRHAILVQS